MFKVTRTAYGLAVQNAKYLGGNHVILPYTTVNESLNDGAVVPYQPTVVTNGMDIVDPYDSNDDTDQLKLQYMVIGNRGHRFIAGPQVPVTTEVPHKTTDAGLYGMIPFVVRPVTNDLTAVERSIYRLRKTVMIDNILYAAYYARKIDVSGIVSTTRLTNIVAGQPVSTTFSPTLNNLRPPVPDVGVANDGSYISTSSPVSVIFTDTEVAALKDACSRMFNDEDFAIISEIGFCTGVDKAILEKYPDSGSQVPVAVTPDTYYETVGVQINIIASTYYPVSSTNAGFTFGYDLGGAEPLFGEDIS